jgi:hypothetical protein
VTGPDPSPLLFFVRAPVAGRVKSRLASSLGDDAAVELYQCFVLDLLATIDAGGFPCSIFLHPPDARDSVAAWLGGHRHYRAQTGADLGSRMENAFRAVFASGVARAVLLGSDVPDLPGVVIAEAFAALQSHDAVIGPAADGGYYLIGFRSDAFRPEVFRRVAWSTDRVFPETRDLLHRAGSRVQVLRTWQDVDTIDDLRSLQRRARGTPFERSRTLSVIERRCGTM